MSIPLYMDEHVPQGITDGLRRRAVDVLTAQEDGAAGLPDPDLLDRATALGRALVTFDHDFEEEAARCQQSGKPFAGVIYILGHLRMGQCIDELELVSAAGEPADLANLLQYIPL
ncbi:MAG TPA: DUF5615 family PIN-like protein [Tepidisphaeraceae bacterium]|jgi:predicted nuclease of predicted toxin-antitoxin system